MKILLFLNKKVIFQEGKGTNFEGCVFCDEKYFEENVESKEAKKIRRGGSRGRRGRGKRRGGHKKF